MARFWTADLHLGHENIIRYCNRPFADVGEMNAAIINRWNERVGPNDEVWVLGDVAMGEIEKSLERVSQLMGRKVLVAGNHDRCWYGNDDPTGRWERAYRDAGFEEIHQGVVETTIGDHSVRCCHFPSYGDSKDEPRFSSERPLPDGRPLIHGHIHEHWKVDGLHINVGVDVWDFAPVSDDELLAIIEEM